MKASILFNVEDSLHPHLPQTGELSGNNRQDKRAEKYLKKQLTKFELNALYLLRIRSAACWI
jgi:hypothetical protein